MLSLKNFADRKGLRRYFHFTVEIKDCDVMVYGRNVVEQLFPYLRYKTVNTRFLQICVVWNIKFFHEVIAMN